MISGLYCQAQVEHVAISHPVYSFLLHAETRGMLPHYSLSSLPLQRIEIIEALKLIRKNESLLIDNEKSTLELYEIEFEIRQRNNSVVFYSDSDTDEVLSKRMFGNNEKFIYRYKDSSNNVNVSPLASFEGMYKLNADSSSKAVIGNLGIRLFGTIGNTLGYYLQATNGALLTGDREVLLDDNKLHKNVKFSILNSDFDFTESHVRVQYDWFYAIIGRESRLLGAGIHQRLFISDNAPPFDAISLGCRFSNFEYRYTHGSLLGISVSPSGVGSETKIPEKYLAIHRFALKPEWGEIAFWENTIYSGRSPDFAYENPLSFFKSLEHSLHDRDNSMMGLDGTFRLFNGLQIKGSYLLDDIIITRIGTGFWSNKSAWNLGIITSLFGFADVGLEYSRVEPYTFTHFNIQNSMTNDSVVFGSYLLPNSDAIYGKVQLWMGGRYPLSIDLSYMRHGKNVYDGQGNLLKNVGGDPLLVKTPDDSDTVIFLDGILEDIVTIQISAGWEIIRGFNLHGSYTLQSFDGRISNSFRIALKYEDF
ncbi:MAG: hypothetical protein QG635_541 [Bacteroidota bacterium]|nr:hypothetical protein [Bacteroidota bacterium]